MVGQQTECGKPAGENEVAISYEELKIPGGFELPGIGVVDSEVTLSIPQVGYVKQTDEKGNEIEVFDGFDADEMFSVLTPQTDKDGKVTKSVQEIAVSHFNNGLKAAMRSGGYASARSLSNVKGSDTQKEQVKNLKKTLDSFVENFKMSPEQAAAAVVGLPGIQELLADLRKNGVLKDKSEKNAAPSE